MNSNVFRSLSYGVYIIGTMDGERKVGCTANSAMQITSQPATIAISINHNNYTNSCIEKSGKFSISILSVKSESSLIGTFGFQSSKDVDKFTDVANQIVEGVPVVLDGNGYIVCRVINKMETETHTVFLGEVIEAEVLDESTDAMTYSYYHKVVKGKSPKNAPTYLPEETQEEKGHEKKTKYICQVCGYVYEGETMPPDFICPICKQGADKFKKVE